MHTIVVISFELYIFYTRDKVFCVHRERATIPVIMVLYSTHNLLQGKDKIKITIR